MNKKILMVDTGDRDVIKFRRYLLFLSLITFFAFSEMEAATISSATSGPWSESSTWQGGVVPNANDDVVVQSGHTVHIDLDPNGNSLFIAHHLTVDNGGFLQLGYNGTNVNKVFAITGNLIVDGTLSAGRNVPDGGTAGEGLIYDHNSSLLIQLTQENTQISGAGYVHPDHLIIKNESTARNLFIEHYNISTDGDFKVQGLAKVSIELEKDTYLRVRGSFGITGGKFAESAQGFTADFMIKGIVYTEDISLFNRNTTMNSSITINSGGAITTNTINEGNSVQSASGGFQLTLQQGAIFRCGKVAGNPNSIAGSDPFFSINNQGDIRLYYGQTLTTGAEVTQQIGTFDRFNTEHVSGIRDKVGATHIAGWYNFSERPYLLEGKDRFKEWGSTNIKTTISANNGKMFSAYPFNHDWPSFSEPSEVVKHPFIDSLFSDPHFKTHAFWAPSKGVNGFYKNGPDRNHDRYLEAEAEMYRAAREILLEYGDSGKKFIFQNWEGDWMLRGSNRQWESDPSSIPDDIDWQIEGMARMWRAYNRGIERARAEFPEATAKIEYAVEVNKIFYNSGGVRKTMMELNVPSLVADVLPKVRMDLSSWSAYDGNFDEASRPFPTGLWNGLEIAAYFTNNILENGEIAAQIGEYGLNENPPFQGISDATIIDRYDKIVAMTWALGVQNVYLWNLYGSGQQSAPLEKDVQYETSYLYEVLDGKWVIEPNNSFGVAASNLREKYFFFDNSPPSIINPIEDLYFNSGFSSTSLDLTDVFADPNGDPFTITAAVDNQSTISIELIGSELTISEVAPGQADITLTASDGLENGSTTFTFSINISESRVFIGTDSYQTITEAINAAVDGDIIDIRGVHVEPLTITKGVYLRGEDPELDKILAAATLQEALSPAISLSRENGVSTDMNVTIENLGIANGSSNVNGGGINADKLQGLLVLNNLIIENNYSQRNGGGLSVAGTSADIIDCTIRDNEAALDGGGVILAPNNSVSTDSDIRIIRSLIDNNLARNGGGIYINGNKGFGNDHLINVYMENTIVSNNEAFSPASGAGGGAMWTRSALWTSDNSVSNVTLDLVHLTMLQNSHASYENNGLRFSSLEAGAMTNFRLFNSIMLTGDDLLEKSINFNSANLLDASNSILGSVNEAPASLGESARNIQIDKSLTYLNISTTLAYQGGKINVFSIAENSPAVDYCTAAIALDVPQLDARGRTRTSFADAGAFEYVVNNSPTIATSLADEVLEQGFNVYEIDLANAFTDVDGDKLSLSVVVDNESVVTAEVQGTKLLISEVGIGTSSITITASDFEGSSVSSTFNFTVELPVNLLADKDSEIVVYPNPAKDYITINTISEGGNLSITTLSGQLVLSTDLNNRGQYNISQIQDGFYLIFISLKNGDQITKKLRVLR